MIAKIKRLFHFNEDAMSEQEVIDSIERGVDFQGAKLWILIIAVFVASLGLNTNSAAVIIGAMLISPLMGPIIGMGMSVAIYDFELLHRSWRNYIVATAFSILTATIYFLITPFAEAQSELMARTSPTIYDVLIALCGGLAGIIAISSRSQRTGNVIPGVAIATALMPPLCTVGFGLATANWGYALGALYLFLINSIFIALATFVGTSFIMKYQKKTFLDKKKETRNKRIIMAVTFITIIPSIWLTIGMVRENNFNQRVNHFIQQELHFAQAQVIAHRADFKEQTFKVVLIGSELDSVAINNVRSRLTYYGLNDVGMELIQGSQSRQELDNLEEAVLANNQELIHDQAIIDQQRENIASLTDQLHRYTDFAALSLHLSQEAKTLFPQVASITLARGQQAFGDSILPQAVAVVTLNEKLSGDNSTRLSDWLTTRVNEKDLQVILNHKQ